MDSFSSLMEFAVAIAGFSGITIAIQARDGRSDDIRSFRNRNLLSWSLCAAFGAMLPYAALHLGARDGQVWAWSSGVYAFMLLLPLYVPFAGRAALSPEQRSLLSTLIWMLGIGGTGLVALVQLVNAWGGFGEPSGAPLFLGVLWMILFAAMQFYRNLFGPR